MNFSPTEQQLKRFREVKEFTLEHLNTLPFIQQKSGAFSREDWALCAQGGLHGLGIPESYGGSGGDALSTVLALEALGEHCEDAGLPFAIAAQLLSCTIPLLKFGTEEQKNTWLPQICSGKIMVANSITEALTGSDVYNMQARAVEAEHYFTLHAEKTYITNAPLADLSLLYAKTNPDKGYFGGVTAFLVDHGWQGVDSTEELPKMGLESVKMGRQSFQAVQVPHSHLLGKKGAGGPIFQFSMEWERGCLGAIHVGLMQKILNEILKYAKERKVGGQYLHKNQVIAHRIADMQLNVHTARMLLYEATWSLENKKSPGLSTSMAKLYISEALQKVCREAFQMMGGKAYLKGSFIEGYLRDALSATIYSGTSDIQRSIISSFLGI
jgi:alkylation response protein AidB-like acyl-CoA dehydrogenase